MPILNVSVLDSTKSNTLSQLRYPSKARSIEFIKFRRSARSFSFSISAACAENSAIFRLKLFLISAIDG